MTLPASPSPPTRLQVRFFERVKLERRLNRLQARLAAAGSAGDAAEAAALQQQAAAVQDDLQYVLHFPKGEKYVSLLRQAEDPAAQVCAWVSAGSGGRRALLFCPCGGVGMDEGRDVGYSIG